MANKAGAVPSARGPVATDDNEPKGLSQEERGALFLVHLKKAREDNIALEKAMEIVRGVRKQRNRNRNECKTDGFSLKYLDEILADEVKTESEKKQDAETRTFMRRTAAIPVTGDDQLDLFSRVPSLTSKGDQSLDLDDAHWTGVGYAAGLRADDGTPPEGTPPERVQAWMVGWQAGQAKIVESMKTVSDIEARRQPAAASAE